MQLQTLSLIKTGIASEKNIRYTNPQMVFETCKDMANLDREHFVVLHLDNKNRTIARETVSIGSLNQTIVHPREVFKAAVHNGSAAIICVHNHPSGDPAPSPEDIAITHRLRQTGDIIGIKVLDHIIIGQDAYVSFVETGYAGDWQGSTDSPAFKKELTSKEQFKFFAGDVVKKLRKRAKMTQKMLADAAGICQPYISQIEKGFHKMTESEALKISNVFNINHVKLLRLQLPQDPAAGEV